MEFLDDYVNLEPAQRDRFQHVISRLLAGEVLTPGSPLKPDQDWRFAERYRELIDSYLRIGAWRFDIDLGLRIARAVHETGAQRVRFSKLESLVLCYLRLYYHEQMRIATEDDRCEITIGVLRERLVHVGRPAAQLSARVLAPALRRLGRHSLVQVERGFEARDDDVVVVTPLIERVLPPDRIEDIEQKVRAYVASRPSPGAQEVTNSESEVPEEEREEDPA